MCDRTLYTVHHLAAPGHHDEGRQERLLAALLLQGPLATHSLSWARCSLVVGGYSLGEDATLYQ